MTKIEERKIGWKTWVPHLFLATKLCFISWTHGITGICLQKIRYEPLYLVRGVLRVRLGLLSLFCRETVSSLPHVLTTFWSRVRLRENTALCHKDSETVHTANNPILYFETGLSDGIKRSRRCHSRSPDPNGWDVFCVCVRARACVQCRRIKHIILHWTRS